MSTKPRTTAAELIEMLQTLPPDTHVFVDIGMYDWEYSDKIYLSKFEDKMLGPDKMGAFHLSGVTR